MKKVKKIGMLSMATVLSSGILATSVSGATTMHELEEKDKVTIQVMDQDATILKSDVIERFKELFPGEFDHLNDDDFQMDQMQYPEDETVRYTLNFNKEIDGEYVSGSARFVGEDLQLELFRHEPANVDEATFPPKVTKDEAEKIAVGFLEKFSTVENYQLDSANEIYQENQTLLDPIRYSFHFIQTNEGVPIAGETMNVIVLGNGEVAQFFHSFMNESSTFDDKDSIQEENVMLRRVKDHLAVDLQYRIDANQTDDHDVTLVYAPSNGIGDVHAISGDWQIGDEFVEDLPEDKQTYLITEASLRPKHEDFTVDQARAFAEEFLAIDLDGVTLEIQLIDERKNDHGKEVINIQYMYEYEDGGIVTSLQLDPETGEITHYNDIKSHLMEELGIDAPENKDTISETEALEQAVHYLEQYTPSILHQYALPANDGRVDEEQDVYYFTFQRHVNGIPVIGDSITVLIAADGTLQLLDVTNLEIDHWPSIDDVISKEQATDKYKDELSLSLRYLPIDPEESHYDIVYRPLYNEGKSRFLNASTGEWMLLPGHDDATISHPTAEEELNFLISAGILDIGDQEAFDPDADITKGDAIELIMKSIRPIRDLYYPGREGQQHSFDNIDPNHSLYQVVEHAVQMGILDTDSKTFDLDANLTKEELAAWYIRGIGLKRAVEMSDIDDDIDFDDSGKINEDNIDYVALADALGLVTADPEQKVTTADVAVSVFKFAALIE